jgi:hypothetical protein
MQATICNAQSNVPYKFMSLFPLLVCFKILIDPLPFFIMFHFSPFGYIFGIISPPLSLMTNLVQSRSLAKDIQLGLIQGQASSHLQMRVIMHHVELNTYSLFSRSNTRFTSPQTCHMLPLDHIKHGSNSGTIQASNSFDFHE